MEFQIVQKSSKHKHHKHSHKNRNLKPSEPSVNTKGIKEELKELEERKLKLNEEIKESKAGKHGFGKFAASLAGLSRQSALNRQINQRRNILGTQQNTIRARSQVQFLNERTKLEKAKTELREAQKKNAVSFEGISAQPVGIKYEDLFK
jgi:translation elongation factor EF-1beta